MGAVRNHIIFDLDGTLIDSKAEIIHTYTQVFQEIEPEIISDPGQLNFGATLQDVLESVYGDNADKKMKARKMFSGLYDTSRYLQTTLYEDVEEVLRALVADHHKLYIATNKRLAPTVRIMEIKHIGHFFSDTMANEMQPGVTLSKREMISDLKMRHHFSRGFMVGDSASDILAGKSENLSTIAVTYGYENRDIFAALNPTYTIDSFRELIPLSKAKKA